MQLATRSPALSRVVELGLRYSDYLLKLMAIHSLILPLLDSIRPHVVGPFHWPISYFSDQKLCQGGFYAQSSKMF